MMEFFPFWQPAVNWFCYIWCYEWYGK